MSGKASEEDEVALQDDEDETSDGRDLSSSASQPSNDSTEENERTAAASPAKPLPTNRTIDADDPAQESKEDDSSSAEACESCPICLNPTKEFVSGPCRHSLCVECMELLLNANAEVERWPPPAAADSHLSAPTLGRCPICRSALSLFDVVNSKTLKPLCPLDTDYWKLKKSETKVDQEEQSSVNDTVGDTISRLSQSLASSVSISTPKHPLRHAVYTPYRGMPGELSFHWDWDKVRTHDNDLEIIRRPFLNLTLAIRRRPESWRLDDQKFPRPIQFMEKGCHFHKESRTFHGKILWPVPLKGSYEWDIILGFSKDYRFISSGRVHHKRGRKLKPGDVPDSYTEKENELCKHPMDGRWTVIWKNRAGYEKRHEVHVINNEFKQSGWPFFFNFQDPSRVFVNWPRSRHRQTIVEGIDLMKEPQGPPVGHRIRWETSDPNSPDLVWIRQTIGPNPVEMVHDYGMGQGKFLYQRLNADLGNSIPKYNGKSVFGNVFTKRMYIGSASYHFVSPTESFISYRHPACRDLPPMDDGSPLPTRVNFHNLKWDPEERKLTATIEWEKDFGTSWNDNVRWKLNMHFDSEYMVILKGGIQCEWCNERRARPHPPRPPPRNRPPPVPIYVPPTEDEDERPQQPPQPDRNEEWVMSGYGHDQLYVNAACLERYRSKSGENGGDEDESPDIDYRSLCVQHQKRLEKEGATRRSISFLTHLFRLADHEDVNPIDFLL
jgi:hypothetical protein